MFQAANTHINSSFYALKIIYHDRYACFWQNWCEVEKWTKLDFLRCGPLNLNRKKISFNVRKILSNCSLRCNLSCNLSCTENFSEAQTWISDFLIRNRFLPRKFQTQAALINPRWNLESKIQSNWFNLAVKPVFQAKTQS